MVVTATPTVYPAFYDRIAESVGSLQYVANTAYLVDASGSEIESSRVTLNSGVVTKGLVYAFSREVLSVTYINNLTDVFPVALRFVNVDSGGVESLLVHFDFDAAVTVPGWGFWTIEFSVTFTS